MPRHYFCRPDGRLVKLFIFSTLLDNSPLTSVYFATFEKKREVRSPLPHSRTFWFLVIYIYKLKVTLRKKCSIRRRALQQSIKQWSYQIVKQLFRTTGALFSDITLTTVKSMKTRIFKGSCSFFKQDKIIIKYTSFFRRAKTNESEY